MINWFPGHMNKTLKQMQQDSKICDCFVYILDSRCPLSCINPEFVKVIGNKPIIFVLNKSDLVEKKDIEKFVNDAINASIPVEKVELKFKDALAQGAYGVLKANDDDIISVYKIGDVDFQICGGPHAKNTSELKNFKILKQEAVSAGIRRIKAVINQ